MSLNPHYGDMLLIALPAMSRHVPEHARSGLTALVSDFHGMLGRCTLLWAKYIRCTLSSGLK